MGRSDPDISIGASWEFYVSYSSSTSLVPPHIRVFVVLVLGAILVKLLIEIVTRRGLTHGYVVFFVGELMVSTMRAVGRENQQPEWLDRLKLSASVLACAALTLFVLARLRSGPKLGSRQEAIESDKPKHGRIDPAGENNPYAPPKDGDSLARNHRTSH